MTQYKDFKGAISADFESRHETLSNFLKEKGIDSDKYEIVRITFGGLKKGNVIFSFICQDKKNSEFVRFPTIDDMCADDFFDLFKRIHFEIDKKGVLISEDSEIKDYSKDM